MPFSISNAQRHARRIAAFAALLVIAACAGEAPEFTGERAWEILIAQCELGPRVPGSAAHTAAIRFITDELEAAGARVVLQRFTVEDPYGDGNLNLTNVVGSFSPDEKKRLLLAAHFDSRPWADEEEVDSLRARPVLGANDGASGVGVLLELAAILAAHPPKGLGVDLVFFDGEDYGKSGDLDYYLMGSKYFASRLGGYRPVCGVLLDMVGAKDARIRQEGFSRQHAPEITRELFAMADSLSLDVFVSEPGEAFLDDHLPLIRAGIPMVDLIGLPWEHWHTVRDTPENCSPETLRQVGTLLRHFVYNFSF